MRRLACGIVASIVCGACSGQGFDSAEEAGFEVSTPSVHGRGGVSMRARLVWDREQQETTLHVAADRQVVGGRAFAAAGPMGEFVQTSDSGFDVVWGAGDLVPLALGEPVYIDAQLAGVSRPVRLHVVVGLRPTDERFSLKPIVNGGAAQFRLSGPSSLGVPDEVHVGERWLPDESPVKDAHVGHVWSTDLSLETLKEWANGPSRVSVASRSWSDFVNLEFDIERADVTWASRDDLERAACAESTRECVKSVPDGALDLAACGSTLEIGACVSDVGVFVDAQKLRDFADDRLGNSRMTEKVETQLGRWYPNEASSVRAMDLALRGKEGRGD